MNPSVSNISHTTDQHVTAVITHRAKAGRQEGYEEWIKGISAAAREFTGHLGVSILRPQPDLALDYVIVLQFDACNHLTAWLKSDIRNAWIARVKPLIQAQETIQILSGLESWLRSSRSVVSRSLCSRNSRRLISCSAERSSGGGCGC